MNEREEVTRLVCVTRDTSKLSISDAAGELRWNTNRKVIMFVKLLSNVITVTYFPAMSGEGQSRPSPAGKQTLRLAETRPRFQGAPACCRGSGQWRRRGGAWKPVESERSAEGASLRTSAAAHVNRRAAWSQVEETLETCVRSRFKPSLVCVKVCPAQPRTRGTNSGSRRVEKAGVEVRPPPPPRWESGLLGVTYKEHQEVMTRRTRLSDLSAWNTSGSRTGTREALGRDFGRRVRTVAAGFRRFSAVFQSPYLDQSFFSSPLPPPHHPPPQLWRRPGPPLAPCRCGSCGCCAGCAPHPPRRNTTTARAASRSRSTGSASPSPSRCAPTSPTTRQSCRTSWATRTRRTPGWRCTSSTRWWRSSAPRTWSSSSAPCTRPCARCWSRPSPRAGPCASGHGRDAKPWWTNSASSGRSGSAARRSPSTVPGRSAWARTHPNPAARPRRLLPTRSIPWPSPHTEGTHARHSTASTTSFPARCSWRYRGIWVTASWGSKTAGPRASPTNPPGSCTSEMTRWSSAACGSVSGPSCAVWAPSSRCSLT